MDSLAKADIFFVVTTVVVAVLGILLAIFLIYAIRTVRTVKDGVEKIKESLSMPFLKRIFSKKKKGE